MFTESAKQDVKVSFGQDFVIMGGNRVEVSPDSNVVVYTNEGVQTKAAIGGAVAKGTHTLAKTSIWSS